MLRSRHELRNLMTHYTAASIAEALGTHAADWQWGAGCIKTELVFKDFKTAFAFMSKVADMAEKLGHHRVLCAYGLWSRLGCTEVVG